MKASKIILSNRTKEKAENLKNLFEDLEIVDWGEIVDFDMIINATSIGLKNEDGLNFDYSANGPNKFFKFSAFFFVLFVNIIFEAFIFLSE